SREPSAHGTKIYGYVSTRRSTCLCARSDPCISYSIDFSSRLLTDTSFEVLVLNLYSSVKELSSIGNRVVVDLIDLAFTSLWSICTSRIIEVRLLVLTLVVWVKGIRYVSHFFLSQLFLPKALLLLEVVEIGFTVTSSISRDVIDRSTTGHCILHDLPELSRVECVDTMSESMNSLHMGHTIFLGDIGIEGLTKFFSNLLDTLLLEFSTFILILEYTITIRDTRRSETKETV